MKNSHPSRVYILSFLVLASVIACQQLGLKGIMPSSVNQDSEVSPTLLNKVSNTFYNIEISKREKNSQIEAEPKVVDQVNHVFEHVKQVALSDPKYGEVAKEQDWRLKIIKDKEIELAKAYPGGGIAVYEGVFEAARNEGALAGILGHEMAHVLAGHQLKRLSALVAGGGVSIAALTFAISNPDKMDPKVVGPVAGALGVGYLYGGGEAAWEREQEREADCTGLSLAAKAGYNPDVIEQFWRRVSKDAAQANKTFAFLSGHPMGDERYDYIKNTCLKQAKEDFAKVEKTKHQKAEAELPGVTTGPAT